MKLATAAHLVLHSAALVPVPPGLCPTCRTPARTVQWATAALFAHGGHGETKVRMVRWCPCGWSLLAAVLSASPRL